MKKISAVILLTLAFSATAFAANRDGKIQAGGGVGVALNPPIRFDLNLNGEYFLTQKISLGLNFDVLLRGPTTFVFVPFARYHFDLDFAPGWVPYAGGGIGGGVDTNGAGFLDVMVPEFGFKYELLDNKLFVGSDLSFHILTNFDNTTWDFRFLIATASFRF